jgi:hypothetical protein
MMNEKGTTMSTWDQLSRKDQLASMHYDFYKDVHGIRPRWMNYDAMSEADLEKELAQLEAESIVEDARRAEAEKRAIDDFEMRVAVLLVSGAKTREQAIDWIKESENASMEDNDYVCYLLGLPYGYLDNSPNS